MVEETIDSETSIDCDEVPVSSFPTRFRLWHLFYATALIAVCCALSINLLLPVGIWFVICAGASLEPTRIRRFYKLLPYTAVLAVPSCCFGGLLFVSIGHHAQGRSAQCACNMRQIMLAMLNYESANREFPTPIETDSTGQPMHSWRVRILPYIEQQHLYDQYDFDQAWDSAHNLKLVDQMPRVYHCPYAKDQKRTFYKLVVGPGSLFEEGVPRTFGSIRDGTSNTIALLEDPVDPVEWTRPGDLTIEEALQRLKPKDAKNFPHVYDSTFNTLYLPGNFVHFDGCLGKPNCCQFHESEVRKMLQINDGGIVSQRIDPNHVGSRSVNKLAPQIAVTFLVLLLLYPLSWIFRNDGPAKPLVST